MVNPLPGYSGNAAAPGYTFSNDGTSGMYLVGAGDVGISAAGVEVIDIQKTAVTFNAPVTFSSPPTFTTLSVSNGTAIAPSYSFKNDSTTGLYLAAVGDLGITAGGYEQIDLAYSSGTSTLKLGVQGKSTILLGNNTSGTNIDIESGSTSGSPAGFIKIGNNSSTTQSIVIGSGSSTTTTVDIEGGGGISIGTNISIPQTITIGNSTSSNAVDIDIESSTSGYLKIGAGSSVQSLTIGNVTSGSTTTLFGGPSINVGTGNTAQTVNIGNTIGASAIVQRVGTGNYSLDGVATSTYTIGPSTTSGNITIGGTAQTGILTVGQSSAINSILIGSGSGATTVGIANGVGGNSVSIANGAGINSVNIGTAASVNTVTIGSTSSTSTTTIQAGSGLINLTRTVTTNSSSGGYIYTGILTATSGTTTATLNGKVGTVSFTGGFTLLSGSSQTFTINNSQAGSVGLVSLIIGLNTAQSGASILVQSVTWTSGSNIVVTIFNYGGSSFTATPTTNILSISFISFN